MKTNTWIATTLLAAAPLALGHGFPDIKNERSGDLFRQLHWGQHWDVEDGVIHDGNSTGVTVQAEGETLYLAYPRGGSTENAIVYFTDIFGLQLVNNRLLADSLARAGYFVVLPDLFRADPVPADALSDPNSSFNMTEWRTRHPITQTEEIIDHAITAVRTGFNASHVAAVGYCFGGRFVARHLATGGGVDVGFAAHPSSTTADEWNAVVGPISLAFGELDGSNTPENRTNIEGIFSAGNKSFQTSLYAQAEHGFAVRTNLSVPLKAFAQESAYWQAVRWFDAWVKGEY
ncbi:hypothetical protein LTR78_005936 [Recurvomyces mirabilis]|uniref:Dienelactone hydrolase domain-containing protein n=1 Tax=Recurvomyces mirabilis TaxID=574656 RepID=A0AAE0WLT3_9PEZI|nr:hypothetical protein LTR78_005936 [Recurvomyces mirabilis]KAK5155254.1 hypothetical protein LTS14_006209 [Recurvomyces mirabilis]